MKIKEKEYALNDGHYLELLDRVYVISCNVETHCVNHPLSKNDNDIKEKLETILDHLGELYQIIGSKIK